MVVQRRCSPCRPWLARARGAPDPGAVCGRSDEVEQNDYRDAEAIAEAVERENIVRDTSRGDQLDLQALHRVPDRLVARRTAYQSGKILEIA